jgi:arsenate reductase (glutaredoxin)
MSNVQIFGLKNSQATRAAERFFKERRVTFQLVDLKQKPMAPAEIKRFVERFGLAGLLDNEGKAYMDAGLSYLKLSDSEMLARIERDPKLLRLPLVRAGSRLSAGHDEDSWKAMLANGALIYEGQWRKRPDGYRASLLAGQRLLTNSSCRRTSGHLQNHRAEGRCRCTAVSSERKPSRDTQTRPSQRSGRRETGERAEYSCAPSHRG